MARAAHSMVETGDPSFAIMALFKVGGHGVGMALGKIRGPKCFIEGTQVLAQAETGEAVPVAIETVEAGDLVWSRCDKTGEEGFKVVVETYVRETDELVHLSYRTEGSNSEDTLTGTAEHPFWSLTADDWVDMGELKVGEMLSLTSGTAVVTGVLIEVLAEPVKVYNFQVKDYHTYFAAPEADKPFVWVHNANGYSQVDYGSTDLSQRAIAFRKENGISSGRNVAVFEIDTPSGPQYRITASARGKGHAERLIDKELVADGISPNSVTRIYSELEPCEVAGGYCKRMLSNKYGRAQKSYSFEYGDQASRQRGVTALKSAVGKIFGGK